MANTVYGVMYSTGEALRHTASSKGNAPATETIEVFPANTQAAPPAKSTKTKTEEATAHPAELTETNTETTAASAETSIEAQSEAKAETSSEESSAPFQNEEIDIPRYNGIIQDLKKNYKAKTITLSDGETHTEYRNKNGDFVALVSTYTSKNGKTSAHINIGDKTYIIRDIKTPPLTDAKGEKALLQVGDSYKTFLSWKHELSKRTVGAPEHIKVELQQKDKDGKPLLANMDVYRDENGEVIGSVIEEPVSHDGGKTYVTRGLVGFGTNVFETPNVSDGRIRKWYADGFEATDNGNGRVDSGEVKKSSSFNFNGKFRLLAPPDDFGLFGVMHVRDDALQAYLSERKAPFKKAD